MLASPKRPAERSPSPSPSSPSIRRRRTDVLPAHLRSPSRCRTTAFEEGCIHGLAWSGMGTREISRVMGVSRGTVLAVSRRTADYTVKTNDTILGHHRSLTAEIIVHLSLSVILNPTWSLRDSREALGRLQLEVSSRTARRALREMGIARYRRVYRPLLKPKHVLARWEFCNMCWLHQPWARNIIFTDETYVDHTQDGQSISGAMSHVTHNVPSSVPCAIR
eukprot:TRINITY_DN442_c0_g1_i2.p1 TRINITY_DN442_c0_g1~~TRINITY_DN442_c0_g1_i2.p1  ORF type:complete len:221 (+),score=12.40 TRINITY_DN442_c0_g1_i2:332-994(+)